MALPRIYTDENAARRHLEKLQWPDGPVCPTCGTVNEATKLKGKSTRPGVYKCRACQKPFSVTVGTVYERSHVPLHKWIYATHLLTSSKKGMSSHQLMRTLGVTYKTAWFMSHRIREAMRPSELTPMGGEGKTVEVDETYFGGLENPPKVRRSGQPFKKGGGVATKRSIVALVERGGSVRSFHVDHATQKSVSHIVRSNVSRESRLHTDESKLYSKVGKEFAGGHGRVRHAAHEYVRDDIHTNTIEGYFSIFKRGMKGIYQHCSEKHLHRYLSEFDFRYSNRSGLGIEDAARADKALEGIRGKRLTYRRTYEA